MLPRDTLSLSQVARTGAVLPIGDPRQQAFQRALSTQLGQSMQAEVLSRLNDGSFVVRVADQTARMPLPPGAEPGQQVPLTLVALNPRPTFQVDTGKGPAFAEAAPAPQDGAHAAGAGQAPLAYLEGKDAAALSRTSALLAQTRALAQVPAGSVDGGNASISRTGQLLGEVIAAAQNAGAAGAGAIARAPLLGAATQDAGQIAAALKEGIDKSGLFYESHVAEWAQGARTLGELAAEPQARGMPSPTEPAAAQLINQQLSAQEQGRVVWQGQLTPGQQLQWEIERREQDGADGRQSGAAGAEGGAWHSRLLLRFPGLGEVKAQLVLSGQQLHIRLDTPHADAHARLDAQRARLASALDAAGTPLATLAIHGALPAPDLDGGEPEAGQ
ncbi:flagellar hook-length control protein FliK [Massilia sp. 9096]|uniref:flagellar hook-length control protein FliK n=1 Tax=Massilia sp. 9096 TaxID=1500894 RepID=UPI00068AD267|nr:flagellar hook-length control protein FliK [Massilia sp. 9096]